MAKKKNWRSADPHAAREAHKYERPIPSRELILDLLEELGAPVDFGAIADRLDLSDEVDRRALDRRLGAMVRDGQILRNRRGDYCLTRHLPVVAGTVIGHRDGFGFLKPDEDGEDVFLPPGQMRELMDGDRALVRISGEDQRGRREGRLVDVLARRPAELAGRYFEEQGIGFVRPDNSRLHHDILIPREKRGAAHSGEMVRIELIEYPSRHTQPIGQVVEVLGDQRAPGIEIELAISAHGLPHEWPKAALAEAEAYGEEIPRDAVSGRLDLRKLDLVTIDGADARDFDDAVYCEAAPRGWKLIVAIADVSHYVTPDSALDDEAELRGTSVYFPDRVIPMLPEALSNGLCSLNPDVDRLCMVCEMRVDRAGKVSRAAFHKGVMRSAARLTYTEVAAVIAGDKQARRGREALIGRIEALHDLYGALRKARDKRGAIDFETTETRIIFDAQRKITAIEPTQRNDAHKLIEECMIAANVAAANFLKKHKMPTLYRVHAGPNEEKLTQLRDFLGTLGLSLGGGDNPEPMHYAKLLEKIGGRDDAHLIQTVLLRSLSQAVYSPRLEGHFGLALEAYAHFTSPIRRYPDLLVHRAIGHVLDGGSRADFRYGGREMERLGRHCSDTERRADEATREAVSWLKAEFMLDKVGEEFDGLITGVTSFGLFVELKNLFVEGLAHVSSLSNDYYRHDPVRHQLVGERSGQVYQLGDALRVRVLRVSLDDRKIDFEPVGKAATARKRRRVRR
ncbi:MAG TPA: ribonuclease R [Gammaproteobacteria bacterium]|nr:ribonuclease R [Gammaproteobacteria bacterium]